MNFIFAFTFLTSVLSSEKAISLDNCSDLVEKRCNSNYYRKYLNAKDQDVSGLFRDFESLKVTAASLATSHFGSVPSPVLNYVLDRLKETRMEIQNPPSQDFGTYFSNDTVILNSSDLQFPRLELIRILSHELGHFFETCNLRNTRIDLGSIRAARQTLLERGIEPIPGIVVPRKDDRENYSCFSEIINGGLGSASTYYISYPQEERIPLVCRDGAAASYIHKSLLAGSETSVFHQVENCYDLRRSDISRNSYGFETMSDSDRIRFADNTDRSKCDASFPSEWFADVIGSKIFAQFLTDTTPSFNPNEAHALFASQCASLQKNQYGYPDFATRIQIFASEQSVSSLLNCSSNLTPICQFGK
jgi:hypothetical protein